MRFWDSSALVALLVEEPASGAVATLLAEDRSAVVWWGARVECVSALRRRERDGRLSAADVRVALGLLGDLSASWQEILAGEELRVSAERALAVHKLSAADALQLAAALTWRGGSTPAGSLVCLDERLRDAASREGLGLLPEALPT